MGGERQRPSPQAREVEEEALLSVRTLTLPLACFGCLLPPPPILLPTASNGVGASVAVAVAVGAGASRIAPLPPFPTCSTWLLLLHGGLWVGGEGGGRGR